MRIWNARLMKALDNPRLNAQHKEVHQIFTALNRWRAGEYEGKRKNPPWHHMVSVQHFYDRADEEIIPGLTYEAYLKQYHDALVAERVRRGMTNHGSDIDLKTPVLVNITLLMPEEMEATLQKDIVDLAEKLNVTTSDIIEKAEIAVDLLSLLGG